jgi:hypothetical protein
MTILLVSCGGQFCYRLRSSFIFLGATMRIESTTIHLAERPIAQRTYSSTDLYEWEQRVKDAILRNDGDEFSSLLERLEDSEEKREALIRILVSLTPINVNTHAGLENEAGLYGVFSNLIHDKEQEPSAEDDSIEGPKVIENRAVYDLFKLLIDLRCHTLLEVMLPRIEKFDFSMVDEEGMTLFQHAIILNATESVIQYLLDHTPGALNRCDRFGRSPLYLAAYHRLVETVEFLLAQPEIDLDLKASDGTSAVEMIKDMIAFGNTKAVRCGNWFYGPILRRLRRNQRKNLGREVDLGAFFEKIEEDAFERIASDEADQDASSELSASQEYVSNCIIT